MSGSHALIDLRLVDLRLTGDLAEWRAEVRGFLSEEMAPDRVVEHLDPTELTGVTHGFERAHHERVGAAGYLGISMPPDVGGGGRPTAWKAVYDFEAAYHDAPSIDTAVTLCGRALADHASGPLRDELRRMVAGRMTGCIGYSETGAGSDMGALQTTARSTGTGWVIDGRKTLVTGGHRADVCLVLVRTDPETPARAAMTMFLVPMSTPGIQVTRHPTIAGWTLEEIEFDGVEVADERRVGEVGAGWGIALGSIGAERAGFAHLGWVTRRVEELLAGEHAGDPRVLELAVAHGRARRFGERVVALLEAGEPIVAAASMAKVTVSELLARTAEIGADLEGGAGAMAGGVFTGDRFSYERLERMHGLIGGGTSELQRDTIARMGLGLR